MFQIDKSIEHRRRCGGVYLLVSSLALACGGQAESQKEPAVEAEPSIIPPLEPLSPRAQLGPGSAVSPPPAALRDPSSQALLGPGGTVITWGDTGIAYNDHPGNLQLLSNVLTDLIGDVDNGSTAQILYTSSCDPRTDQNLCQLVGAFSQLEGFFRSVAAHGEIEFRQPSEVDLDAFDAVIFNPCSSDPSGDDEVRSYVAAGGRALILGDNFCFNGGSSAERANGIVRRLGIRFLQSDPGSPEFHELSAEAQVGLLSGIESIDIFRTVPQLIEHSFTPVIDTVNGVVMARLHSE